MNESATSRAPWHLWVVGIVTLLWNAIGITSYMITRLGKLEAAGMTPEQIAWFESFPAWANGLWALGVWGVFFGSLLLLLRSRWAVTSIATSIVGLIGTTIFERFMTDIPAELDSPPLSAAIWIITLFMLWYALRMRKAGVLR